MIHSLCTRICLSWLAIVYLSMATLAQTPNAPGLEAMRIFVDEKDVDRVVTPAFLTVGMEELDKLLKEYAQQHSLSSAQDTGIQRATYVARWNEQTLVSRASLWQIASARSATQLDVGPVSMALEEPQGAPEQSLPLTRQLRYVDDNHLQILSEQNQRDFWFGFRAKTRRRDSGQHSIDLQIPQAVVSMMLVAVPTHSVVTSNLPCAAVNDVSKYLPEGWPVTALPTLSADEQWFVVWLSGQQTCTLNFTAATEMKGAAYRMLVASVQSDTQVTPAGIQVSSQFRLAGPPPGEKLRLLIEDPLHVRTISVGAVKLNSWKTVYDEPTAKADTPAKARAQVVEIPCEPSGEGLIVVTVDCIGRIPLPYEAALPRIEVEGAYVLDGRCTLLGHERIQIEDARSTAHVLATTAQSGLAQWQWQWTGKAPSTNVRLRVAPNQWTVRALTRLDVQPDVVVAWVHANISSQQVPGNQTTLKLAEGWFIDSIELENAPPGVTIDTASDAAERNIRWDDRRNDLDVRVLLKAHYHQRTNAENLRLTSTRILSLPGADQVDTYIVESSGSFRLELDSELLRMRVREDDLVPWQRALLPRLSDPWIFSAGHAPLPPIRLSRTRATLEAKLHTTVVEDFNQVLASYRVLCKPISGSIRQLKIQMSLPASAVAPTWSIVESFSQPSRAKLFASSSAISSSTGETTFTIELSEDVAEEFQIQAEIPLGRRDLVNLAAPSTISVPLPRMRQAVSQEAVLVVPQRYKLPTLPSLEVLPPGLCCDGGKLVESSTSPEVVAVRYDTSAFTKVDLQSQPTAGNGGWAHTQLHEHWQYRAGRTIHRSTWELASPNAQVLELKIPMGWEFQSLTIDDEQVNALPGALIAPIRTVGEGTSRRALAAVWSADSFGPSDAADVEDREQARLRVTAAQGQTLSFQVPKGDRVRMQMICSSLDAPAWYRPVVYRQPEMPLAALKSRSVVWFPSSRWATVGWPTIAGDWQDRFCPRQWWRLLSFQPGRTGPDVGHSVASASEQPRDDVSPEFERANQKIVSKNGWWKIEFDEPETAPRIWAIDQSLAGAGSLCVFLLLCMVISMACAASWPRWLIGWMFVGAALAVVPPTLLLAMQMMALALVASTLARVARATAARSRAAVKRNDSMQLSKTLLPRAGAVSVWLMMTSALGLPSASAQPFKTGIKEKREVFAILIPVDEKYQVAGEFVYISPRLYGLLKNSNQSDVKSSEVRVANAIYSLSIGNDLVNSTNTVGDVTVELSVQATLADAELRLPFVRSEAALVRAVLDSQSLILGDRIRQEGDNIIWRASDSDRHTLRMILRPRALSQREGRGQLSMAIPAIPTARLEVQSDNLSDLRDIVVDSIGGVQSETFRTLSAKLGPTNRLSVSWPLNANRSAPTQVQSDTWVHSRGNKVMAMCQLRMRGASSSNTTLSVTSDGNWIPVGQDWEDFRMVATEAVSPLGKQIYNVEKLEDRNTDELTLRVLMLPKDESAASLTIPFLSLQSPSASIPRTLAFSYTDSPQWKTVGTDWQPLFASQAAQLWDGTRLAEQPTLWRVPAGTVQGTLQRVAPVAPPSVDESTEVQLQMPESKIKYVARWSTPLIGPPAVRLLIPNTLRLDSALVGAIKARYSIRRLPGSNTTSELVVFIDSSLGGIESLNLQFSASTRLNRAFRIPRPVLMESEVRSSVVQIFRGVELTSTHANVDGSALEMESLDVRDSQLLQALQSPVGRLELGDRLRETPELPLEFTLARAPVTRAGKAVMRLSRSDQGWYGQLDAMVEIKTGEVNHLFFDMPRSLESSLREPLDANVAVTLWPSPDSNRMLLSVLPARESTDQAHISFAFRLPSSGVSQTVNVPDIRMLGVSSPRPALALPVQLAGEAVRWTGIGRPLASSWLQSFDTKGLDLTAFDLFEPIDNQSQAMWHPREQREKDAQVLLTCIELADDPDLSRAQNSNSAQHSHRGAICYWLEPHDHPYLDIDLPATCQLIGMEANDRPSNWQQVSDGRVRVLLQPSYLPSRLRLLVRWNLDDENPTTKSMALPKPYAQISGPTLIHRPVRSEGKVEADKDGQNSVIAEAVAATTESIAAIQAQLWANTLTRAAPLTAGRGGDEMAAWLPSWDPQWIGLDSSALVTVRQQALSSRNNSAAEDLNEEVQLPVSEFWTEFLKQHGQENYSSAGPSELGNAWALANRPTIDEYQWWQTQLSDAQLLEKLTVEKSVQRQDTHLITRWGIGLGWVVLLMTIARLSRRSLRGTLVALGELLWPLWLVLALAAAALLPVLWPALVVGGGLILVLVRRYRQLRRDRQFVLMPKAMR